MQSTWIPIPHNWREGLWLVVAIFIATRKGLKNGVLAFFRTWKTAPAEAAKTYAEAEEISVRSAVSTAALIKEMTMSLAQATLAGSQLKEKVASQGSII